MKLSYELAKELKDAGFPQSPYKYAGAWVTEDGHIYCGGNEPHAWSPDLSGLIEACGKDFFSLSRENVRGTISPVWVAKGIELEALMTQFGATPEEAMTRLWLALNQTATVTVEIEPRLNDGPKGKVILAGQISK